MSDRPDDTAARLAEIEADVARNGNLYLTLRDVRFLLAEVRRLQLENDKLTSERNGWGDNCNYLEAQLTTLTVERDRLQAENAALREPGREDTWPIQLNSAQARSIKQWAADDRLWTTQDTVEANLRIFARVILRDAACAAAQPEEPR